MASKPLLPPVRFTTVEEDLYRSAQPIDANLPFLETLGLRLIISLVPCNEPKHAHADGPGGDPLPAWCEEKNVELVRVHVPHAEGQASLSHADAARVILVIVNAFYIETAADPTPPGGGPRALP